MTDRIVIASTENGHQKKALAAQWNPGIGFDWVGIKNGNFISGFFDIAPTIYCQKVEQLIEITYMRMTQQAPKTRLSLSSEKIASMIFLLFNSARSSSASAGAYKNAMTRNIWQVVMLTMYQ